MNNSVKSVPTDQRALGQTMLLDARDDQDMLPGELRDAASSFTALLEVDPWSSITNAALLSSLLGGRPSKRCERLASLGNLRAIARLFPADLAELGFKDAEVTRLLAFFELARRFGETPWAVGEQFHSSYDVFSHYRERLAGETREIFTAILLDNKNRKLKDVTLSLGSLTASVVHPRDVYMQIIKHAAATVIFVHNHPSGDPTPSPEDLEATRRLREVGDVIGVRVLDHVVIGHGRYVSFVDDGYW